MAYFSEGQCINLVELEHDTRQEVDDAVIQSEGLQATDLGFTEHLTEVVMLFQDGGLDGCFGTFQWHGCNSEMWEVQTNVETVFGPLGDFFVQPGYLGIMTLHPGEFKTPKC